MDFFIGVQFLFLLIKIQSHGYSVDFKNMLTQLSTICVVLVATIDRDFHKSKTNCNTYISSTTDLRKLLSTTKNTSNGHLRGGVRFSKLSICWSYDNLFEWSLYPEHFSEKSFQLLLLSFMILVMQKCECSRYHKYIKIVSLPFNVRIYSFFPKLLITYTTLKYMVWARSSPFVILTNH